MATQARRPIKRLRASIRTHIQHFVGIIKGSHPVSSTSADDYYSYHHRYSNLDHNKSISSATTGRGGRPSQRKKPYDGSLDSISESDEESLTSASTLTDESEVGECDHDQRWQPFTRTIPGGKKLVEDEVSGPLDPFSDFYQFQKEAEEREADEDATGAELVRVNARGEEAEYDELLRQRKSRSGAAGDETEGGGGYSYLSFMIPKGLRWKSSTPGAYKVIAKTTTPSTPKATTASTPSTPSTTTSEPKTSSPNPDPIIELDWPYRSHGAYQTARAAPRSTSWTSSLAASAIDTGMLMGMMECHSAPCDLTVFGQGSLRVSEFDALGSLGYYCYYDMQWLEYMSIPSGGLGRAKRWVGKRLGVCGGKDGKDGEDVNGRKKKKNNKNGQKEKKGSKSGKSGKIGAGKNVRNAAAAAAAATVDSKESPAAMLQRESSRSMGPRRVHFQ